MFLKYKNLTISESLGNNLTYLSQTLTNIADKTKRFCSKIESTVTKRPQYGTNSSHRISFRTYQYLWPIDIVYLLSRFIPAFPIFFLTFMYSLFFYFIFKLYIIVLVLPNIKMNPPQVYMCSPS